MTDYTPQAWQDEIPQTTPLRFKITLANGTVLAADATIELVTPVTPGTPINAARLTHMEEGIDTAQDTANDALDAANSAQTAATAAEDAAEDAETAAAAATTTAGTANTKAETALSNSLQALNEAYAATLRFYAEPLKHADWDGDAKSVSVSSLYAPDFVNSNEDHVPANARAILVAISARWGSASDTSLMNLIPVGATDSLLVVRARVANRLFDAWGIVNLDNGSFDVRVEGANASNVYINIWGYLPGE
jgi:hypothetical protein